MTDVHARHERDGDGLVSSRVIDAFMFNDELDLLELRLRVLDPVVDRFVIVESYRTYAGQSKPLWFRENEDRFKPWLHKIRHEVAEVDEEAGSSWRREEQHRRAVKRVLQEEADDASLLLFGDVDELPDPNLVRWLDRTIDEPVRLRLVHAVYFANWHLPHAWDNSTLAFRPGQFDLPMLRAQLGSPHGDWAGYTELQVDDAGIHLQFVDGPELIRTKWASYAHQEYNTDRYRIAPHLERCVALGVHFTGRYLLECVPFATVPPYLATLARDPAYGWLFNFEASPSIAVREAYCGFTWLRTQHWFPLVVARLFDQQPWLRSGPLGAPFVALHRALSWRRSRRVEPDWRAPRRLVRPAHL